MKPFLNSKVNRPCCLLSGLGLALGLISCSSIPQVDEATERAPRKMVIQPETRWPASASWWTNPNATALGSRNPGEDSAARLESNAKVVSVSRSGSESATITFRRMVERWNQDTSRWEELVHEKPTLTLHGPARLADFLGQGQKVRLEFDKTGNIAKIGDMMSLKSWNRSANRHRIELETMTGNSKTFSLYAVDRQLFNGIADEPSQANEAHLARQYDEYTAPKSGKRYAQLTHAERTELLRAGFEVILTAKGVIFFTGEGYGGGAEAEPEWVLPASASESFE